MQRIPALTLANAPEGSKENLEQLKAQVGRLPNIFASVAHSPAALEALLGMFGALEEGALAGKAHEAIALRVGQIHGCKYCSAAHTAKAKMAGASDEEALGYRKGRSGDPKLQALLDLASGMVEWRGELSDDALEAARKAGVSEAEMLEVAAIVALNTFTNYVNHLVHTKVDFPAAPPLDSPA